MPIPVRLFASLRTSFGQVTSVNIEPPITVAELESHLRERGLWTQGARIAVNLCFAGPADAIHAGDEVAVIAPVSGGEQ